MRVLLTSCGLETERIKNKFLEFLPKDTDKSKALFIPTAATSCDAIQVLQKCMNDLLKCNIPNQNITIYDLHKPMSCDELMEYDVVYLCGGDPEYLKNRINEGTFRASLLEYIRQDGIVIGVSAGSIIFAQNLENNY